MIFTPADEPRETTILFTPLAGALLPQVEVMVAGDRVRVLADMVEAHLGASARRSTDVPHASSMELEPGSTCRILYVIVDQHDGAALSRVAERIAATCAHGVAFLVLAVAGTSLCDAAAAVAIGCDCTLVAEQPSGLLHLLRLILPPPQQMIGYDLFDVLAVWRGGYGQILPLAEDGGPAVLTDLAESGPHPHGATLLVEQQEASSEQLGWLEGQADRVRSLLGNEADLLWCYNLTPSDRPVAEVALVWCDPDALCPGERP